MYRTPGVREPDETDEPAPDPRGTWVLQTWVSQRTCPDCAVALFAAKKEGFRIDACGQCGGAWVDPRTLTRAVEERNLVPAMLSDEAAKRARAPKENRGGRNCPDCAAPLGIEHVTWMGTQVVIDVCHAHGAWFDAHELRATIEARAKAPAVDAVEELRRGVIADLVSWANRPLP